MKLFILIILAALIQISCLYGQDKKLTPVRSQSKRITYNPFQKTKSIKLIPDLVIKDFSFNDENSNKIIDADETNEIILKIANDGAGVAEAVTLRISTKNPVPGLTYIPQFTIGNINPGQFIDIKVPITAERGIKSGLAEFTLEAVESKGFDSMPLEMTISMKQFQEPKVKVVDAVFSTNEGGKIVKNYPINLKILVQNIGNGYASNIKAEIVLKENCFPLDSITLFELGSLNPGQAIAFEFPFTATRRFMEDRIPIRVELEEKYKQFARDTLLEVSLNQSLQAKREVIVEGKPSDNYKIEIASLVAEVDRNIPVDSTKHANKYALIIGNEDYTNKQNGINNEANVIYAIRDAEIFKEYLINTLGFNEENVFLRKDATSAEMNQSIDLLSKLAQRTDSAEIVFYYAGHGLPDEIAQMPYLVPVDVNGTNLSNAIKLTDLYKKLENSNAKQISVYLDACFSGGGRNNELVASRGIRIKPDLQIPPANTIVFSASSGEQSALPYTSKQHGIFTYYLLKKLQDTKGNITYGELANYLKDEVSLQSLKINQKEQDPQVIYGDNNKDNWNNRPIK